MRLGMVPDNVLERLALLSGMLPPGIFECWFGIMLARTVMAATRLELFESLAAGPLTTEEVAQRCGTHPHATEKLLNALVGVGCLQVRGEHYYPGMKSAQTALGAKNPCHPKTEADHVH